MSELNLWKPKQLLDLALARTMQRLPINLTSDIGALLGKLEARNGIKSNRLWIKRLHANIERFHKIENHTEREEIIYKHLSSIGRTYAEFMSQQKIIEQNRIELVGEKYLKSIDQQVIVVSCHLSNWELMGHVICQLNRPICGIYLPPKNPVHYYLATEARLQWSIPHDYFAIAPNAMRRLNQNLHDGSNLLLFIDEERDGYISAPSLGRKIPYSGNRWLAAKLAVKHGLSVLPAYIVPTGKGTYQAIVEPLIEIPTGKDKYENACLLADKMDERLNAWIEPRLDQWFWLRYFDYGMAKPVLKSKVA
jgi:lauroyl/myristoyl acyltransferase